MALYRLFIGETMKIYLIITLVLVRPSLVFAEMKTTRWTPDTCNCTVDFDIDTDNPNNPPILNRFIQRDPVHVGLTDEQAWETLWSENVTKNVAYSDVLENHPEAVIVKNLPDGTITREVKNFKYSFDDKSNIFISADGLDPISASLIGQASVVKAGNVVNK